MLNMRDNRGSFRSVATTANFGVEWTEHSTSYNGFQDPVCMGSIIKANVKVNIVIKPAQPRLIISIDLYFNLFNFYNLKGSKTLLNYFFFSIIQYRLSNPRQHLR